VVYCSIGDPTVYDVEYEDETVEEKVTHDRITASGENKNVGGVLFMDEAG